jgi:hypothetical protein
MARTRLNRAALYFALACAALCAANLPGATAKVYSFKPVRAKGGTVVFLIDDVRPASVRAAQIRLGHRAPHRIALVKARRAVRRGRFRLPIGPIVSGGTAAESETTRLARRHGRLKIVADTTPPETTISSGPSGSVGSQSASFQFASSEGDGRFECRRDSGTWNNCESPKSYSLLAAGTHTFSVRAYDRAGNVDPTPATRTWMVELQPSPEPSPAGTVMFDGFEAANGPNNLITNEYAGWHSSDSTAVHSAVWRSDGGSLFSVSATDASGAASRVAFTGGLDSNAADKYSQTYTHSNKMRFWTKASGFENVRIDADIKATSWGPDAPSSWGGFKFYLRRQFGVTESPFYTVEPYIKDGHLYIQKKCLGDTGGGNYSTGGTYYVLASKSGFDVPLGSWHKIAATAYTNSDGSVTIGLYRDGTLLLQAVDRGIRPDGSGCAPLTAGHLGFRSDSLQYYLDDFGVRPQS